MRNAIITGLLCAASTAAIAQNAATSGNTVADPSSPSPASAAPSALTQLQQVTVTGTLIQGEAAPIGAQLTTIGSTEIANTGAANMADLLATVPALNSFNIAPQGGQSEFNSGGSSTPGIHGLPGTATLVLLDGHRLVGDSPLLTVPDPSSIPPIALANVQVLPTGGSAIYGTDAVAGVINMILKTNFNGAETNVSYGGANSYNTATIQQLFGKTWQGGSFMIAGSYQGNSPLANDARSFYQYAPAGLQVVPDYNCNSAQVGIGSATYSGPGLAAGPLRSCDPDATEDMYNQQRRYSLITTARQDLGGRVQLSFDGKYTDTLMNENAGTEAVQTGTDAAGNPIVTIPSTNPYFFQPPGGTATSENVYMGTGSLGNVYDVYRSRAGMVDFGALVHLAGSWDLDSDVDYSWSKSSALNPNGVNENATAAAADATTPSTALDPFGATNPAVAGAIENWPLQFLSNQSLYDLNVKANGDLFELPAGEAKLAVGVTEGNEKYSGSDPIGLYGETGYTNNTVDASRSTYGVFAQTAVPIIGSANAITGIRKLDVSLALRHDHYSDFGGTTNPEYGIDWVPVQSLMIQGSYGTSFHAPQLADDYGIDTRAGGGSVGAPPPGYVLPSDVSFLTAYLAGGRTGLRPEEAKNTSFGFVWTPEDALTGFKASVSYFMINFSDQVEIPNPSSLFSNAGLESRFVDLNPTGNPADPFAPLTATQLASIFSGIRLTPPLTAANISTLYEVIDLRRANIGATVDNGVDFDFTYHHVVPGGQMMAELSGEYLTKYETNEGAGTPWTNNLTDGNSYLTSDTSAYNVIPWHVKATLGWQIGPDVFTQANVNYTGHFNYGYITSGGQNAIQWVSPFVTVDWLARYYFPGDNMFTHGLTAQLNVDNVLNQSPPLVEETGGFSPESANPLGRFIQLSLTKRW
ncbi:MAG: TonB-dependent receptor [Steroidobacteraceae bacterium]